MKSTLFIYFFIFFFLQIVKLAKKLKKEKVNVDVINFGEEVSICWSCLRFDQQVYLFLWSLLLFCRNFSTYQTLGKFSGQQIDFFFQENML